MYIGAGAAYAGLYSGAADPSPSLRIAKASTLIRRTHFFLIIILLIKTRRVQIREGQLECERPCKVNRYQGDEKLWRGAFRLDKRS